MAVRLCLSGPAAMLPAHTWVRALITCGASKRTWNSAASCVHTRRAFADPEHSAQRRYITGWYAQVALLMKTD